MRKSKKILIISAAIILSLCLLFTVAVVAANIVVLSSGDRIRQELDASEKYDCILILGAGLHPDGTPSDMLADRLAIGVELYVAGVSDVILVSGDRSGEDYDEVSAMEKYCLDNGVPAEAIVKDGAGYSTYESIKNIADGSRYGRVVVVTQKYHLYRALYIAEKLGIESVGVSADERSYAGQWVRDAREVAARMKDAILVGLFD